MVDMTGRSELIVRFSRGVPPDEAIPADQLAAHTRAVLAESGARVFQYPPIGRYLGDPALREQLAEQHGANAGDIMVTNGSLQALDLVAATLLEGGGAVYVEGPTYDRAARIFERHGGWLRSIPMESDGIDIHDLRRRVANKVPAFVYTIPDFQNPSGVSMSEAKRRELVDLADKYGFTIIEDIPYRELRFHGSALPGLRELAQGGPQVITMGSLSKVLSPGLRIGYAISDPDTATALATMSEGIYLSPVGLCQAVAARALSSGLVTQNIKHARDVLRPRHDAAVAGLRELLGDALMAVPDGGYYVGVRIRTEHDEDGFLRRAREAGLMFVPGSNFYPRREESTRDALFLRLPFQSMPPEEFRIGVERLASIVHDTGVVE